MHVLKFEFRVRRIKLYELKTVKRPVPHSAKKKSGHPICNSIYYIYTFALPINCRQSQFANPHK